MRAQTSQASYRGTVVRLESEGEGGALLIVLTAESREPAAASDRGTDDFRLSRREMEVARLLADRRSNEEIAVALGISRHTARHHTERVLAKLGVRSRLAVRRLLGGAPA